MIQFDELPDGSRVPTEDNFGGAWAKQAGRLDFDISFNTLVQPFVPEGGFCVDVGACIGTYTRIFSDLVGRTGLVLAFEPCPENLKFLNWNVGRFPCQNTFVREAAVAASNGFGVCDYKTSNVGESVMEMMFDGEQHPVVFCTLDTSVRVVTTRKLDFLKLDVEGWEFFCLVGGWNLISRDRPVICLEINPPALRKLNCSTDLIRDTLKNLRYNTQMIQDPSKVPDDGVFDLLCLPRE